MREITVKLSGEVDLLNTGLWEEDFYAMAAGGGALSISPRRHNPEVECPWVEEGTAFFATPGQSQRGLFCLQATLPRLGAEVRVFVTPVAHQSDVDRLSVVVPQALPGDACPVAHQVTARSACHEGRADRLAGVRPVPCTCSTHQARRRALTSARPIHGTICRDRCHLQAQHRHGQCFLQ